jgi:hypothetical protein
MDFSKYTRSIMDVMESVDTAEIDKFIEMLVDAYEHGNMYL